MLPSGRTSFGQLMTTLWSSKWPIMSFAILGALLAGFIGLSRPVLYEAKAQLIANAPGENAAAGTPTGTQEAINEIIDGHLTVLVSPSQLRRVIDKLRLQRDDETLSALRQAGEQNRIVQTVVSTARDWQLHLQNRFNPQQADSVVVPEDRDANLVDALRDGMRVGQELRSRVISVGFTNPDRNISTKLANTLAEAYIEHLTKRNRTSTERELAAIEVRTPDVQRGLATAIEKKEIFIVTNGGVDKTNTEQVAREIGQLRQLLLDSKAKLAMAGDQSGNVTGSLHVSAINADRTVQEPTSQEIDFYQSTTESIEKRIAALETKAGDDARRLSRLRGLELEIDAKAGRYNDVLTKRDSLALRAKSPEPGIAILSTAALPTDSKTMSAVFLLPPGFILFGLLAAMFAVFRQSIDATLRGATESEAALGIASAGLLPKLGQSSMKELCRLIIDEPSSPFRRAATSVLLSSPVDWVRTKPAAVLLVTSSTNGESKTELAWSLVLCAQRLGQKVLLIDFDVRESTLTRSFREDSTDGTPARTFSEFANGKCQLLDAVRTSKATGVDFMMASAQPNKLLAGLSIADIRHGVDKIRNKYGLIVVNAPPSVDAPEVCLLADMADDVLFAIAWGSTHRNLARAAIRQVGDTEDNAAKVRFVLTDVNLKQQKRYIYGDSTDLLIAH